ncbi:TetR/AcrR family transcriptional regulator [Williamsia sp.]|uniref:TetR/AcrR family transcriptional regulator n=1 Tax=Williamsia sp. TaxID=1872085 RepID=UPI001A1F265A|nr:TetR/AcrR family transcriptional regulator [Williamsia sp.]MBJ7291682.1 TetR/AcrR family transcriptional regulator [Williamsia sp.]
MKVNESDSSPTRPRRRTQTERTVATRAALLNAARSLFGAQPFADVSTQAIVEAAGVTRGALYHQFGGKTELFDALVETIEEETIAAALTVVAAEQPAEPVEVIRAGAHAWLAECARPEVYRILLIDAPAVLGWDRWREICERFGLGVIESMLQGAIDAGAIPPQPVKATAHVMLGALDEAVLYISRAPDRDGAIVEMYEVVDRLIGALTAR